jgi:hypothetical protein
MRVHFCRAGLSDKIHLELHLHCWTGHANGFEQRLNDASATHQQESDSSRDAFSLEDDILAEHFTRNVQFFGREGQQQIMRSFVVVVGLGVMSAICDGMQTHAGVCKEGVGSC